MIPGETEVTIIHLNSLNIKSEICKIFLNQSNSISVYYHIILGNFYYTSGMRGSQLTRHSSLWHQHPEMT